MKHPNLSKEINDALAQSERDGGIWLKNLRNGDELKMQTQNTLYTIVKTGESDYTIQGHEHYCPTPTPCKIHGSTWGGSMLKIGYVGRGMHLEFSTKDYRTIITSRIKTIVTNRVH